MTRSTACPALCPGQAQRQPEQPHFDGPVSWEEVDTEELERIAVNIMRSVVPSTENLEVGARLAMQAAAMEADNMDPLGLGRIDTRQLALVRSAPTGNPPLGGRSGAPPDDQQNCCWAIPQR